MKYQLIIFDWDGTIMDSVPKIVGTMQAAAERMSLPKPADDAVRGIIGLGLNPAIQQLFPGIESEAVLALREHYSDIYVNDDVVPSPLFEGAVDVLHSFKRFGCDLAVATGKSRRGFNRVVSASGVASLFSYSRCADETHSKPHPAMVNELLAESGVAPDQALVVGDSEFDMEMAQRAGVDRIGVSYGAGGEAQILKYDPLMYIDRIEALLDLLPD